MFEPHQRFPKWRFRCRTLTAHQRPLSLVGSRERRRRIFPAAEKGTQLVRSSGRCRTQVDQKSPTPRLGASGHPEPHPLRVVSHQTFAYRHAAFLHKLRGRRRRPSLSRIKYPTASFMRLVVRSTTVGIAKSNILTKLDPIRAHAMTSRSFSGRMTAAVGITSGAPVADRRKRHRRCRSRPSARPVHWLRKMSFWASPPRSRCSPNIRSRTRSSSPRGTASWRSPGRRLRVADRPRRQRDGRRSGGRDRQRRTNARDRGHAATVDDAADRRRRDGAGVMLVAIDGRLSELLAVADPVRADAAAATSALCAEGRASLC